jgi:thiamine monophosphate kinase
MRCVRLPRQAASACGLTATGCRSIRGAREWWDGRGIDSVSAAVKGGDDYELLFAVPPKSGGALRSVARHVTEPALTKIGVFTKDPHALVIERAGKEDPLPEGFEHFAHR